MVGLYPSAEKRPDEQGNTGHHGGHNEHIVGGCPPLRTKRVEAHPISIVHGVRNPQLAGRGRVITVVIPSILAAVMGLSSCAPGASPPVPVGPDGQGDAALVTGRELFSGQCARCHGGDGAGGRGPRLAQGRAAELYPDVAEQIAVVREGRNSMPSFGAVFSDQEIEAVVRYTREVL